MIHRMKKNNFLFILFALFVLLATRCSNSVDLYADYKEVTVVYGLLDFQDDTTWIKITKAFSGPGNALEFAQNSDSSNFLYKLGVTLTGRKNGVDLTPIVFDTLTIHDKQAGDSIFYFPNQLMYYATDKLDPDAEYTLKVSMKDKELSSKTKMVHNFHITYPVRTISFVTDKEVKWNSAVNGKRYEVKMVFHYRELLPGHADTIDKSIAWYVNTKHSVSDKGGELMTALYSGDNFYNLLKNKLKPIPNVQRWTGNVDVFVACASQDLDTYIQVNNGSTGLLQEIPAFSNITGGKGLLASRHTISQSVPLTVTTERKLIENYTDLGFRFKQ